MVVGAVAVVGVVGFVAGLEGRRKSLRVGAWDCLGKAELVALFLVVVVVVTRPFGKPAAGKRLAGEGPVEGGLALA